jgi:nicotinamidase-related amidase
MIKSINIGSHPTNQWVVHPAAVDISRSEFYPKTKVQVTAEPQNIVVDLNRSAIIVVDMQNDFCSPQGYLGCGGMDCGPAQKLIPTINDLLGAVRPLRVPIIWLNWAVRRDRLNMGPSMPHLHVRNSEKLTQVNSDFSHQKGGWGAFENEWGAEIAEGLDVQKNDIHVKKNRFSGFFNTELDSILRNMGVTTLFFGGVASDICVLATLQDAMFLGYDVVMMEDCVATNSPDYCVDATKYHVRQLYGFTTLSTSLIHGIKSIGDHPK